MNKLLLKKSAEELEAILIQYSAVDSEVLALHEALADILSCALKMQVDKSIEWREVPGSRLFSEGNLSSYSDLEDSFAIFRIEITGGESPALRRLKARRP